MEIKVNDKPYTVECNTTIAALLSVLGVEPKGIAVAVDGTVVPQPDWDAHVLTSGASVVIIKAFYGG